MTLPATESGAVQVQYESAPGVWSNFGPPQDLGTIKRTRRCALGPRQGVTARKWRVVKVGARDWDNGVVSLEAVRFWKEGEDLSPVRLWSFDFDQATQRYVLVMTGGNTEIYHAGERVASLATPYGAEQVRAVTKTQALDTLILFHRDVAPQRVTRQGAHGQWDIRDAAFRNLPTFDYLGTRAGGVNEKHQLWFRNFTAGDTFNLTFEGETTAPIAFVTSDATLATTIQSALEALPSVGVGDVAVVTTAENDVFEITWQGELRATDVADLAPATLKSNNGILTASTLIQGKEGGEPIISAARGWPACGAFYQSRLWMGGLRSRPQTALGSRLGDPFDFNIKGSTSAVGISIDLDTDQVTTITAFFPGQHLQILTSAAEFFFPTEPIVAPPAVKQATRRGVQPGTQQAEMDGATVFVTRGGQAVAEFLYDDSRQNYRADHLSYLASHLVTDIVDMAFRSALSTTDTDRALLTRASGEITAMSALRAQEVTGFQRWTTDGRFLAGCSDLVGETHVAVARELEDGEEILLERVDEDAMLDSEVAVTVTGDPVTTIACPHLNGLTVTLYADGGDLGDHEVVDGEVALPAAALRKVAVGRLFQPRFVSLPLVFNQDPRAGSAMGVRTGEIGFRLGATAGLRAGIAGGRMWPVSLKRRPQVVTDAGPGEDAFADWTRLFGVPGFRHDGQIEFVQARPGPLEVQEIVVTVQA